MKLITLSATLGLALFAAHTASAASLIEKFKWKGVKSTSSSYLLYRSLPGDSTVHGVYISCKRGDSSLNVSFSTRPQGEYTNEELVNRGKRLPEKAKFLVDDKAVGEFEVMLGQAENFAEDDAGAISMEFELEVKHALFAAMLKGRSIRVELPRAKSHAIPLAGFARPAQEMVRHCKL